MTIIAKFPGKCTSCGKPINVGEKIEWSKTAGASHASCQKIEVPDNAITVGGGSGYGYEPYTQNSVIRNSKHNIEQGQPEYLYVLVAKSRYYREEGMSFGVGDESGYIYSAVCRPATAEEAAPLIELIKQREADALRAQELKNIFSDIQKNGEYPQGSHNPEGQEIEIQKRSIYGTGEWIVAGAEYIWAVRNNGMDGDNWSANNVRTGGAGAIGYRVPATAELYNKIMTLCGGVK